MKTDDMINTFYEKFEFDLYANQKIQGYLCTLDINRQRRKKLSQFSNKITVDANELVIGLYLNSYADNELRMKLLKKPRVPLKSL